MMRTANRITQYSSHEKGRPTPPRLPARWWWCWRLGVRQNRLQWCSPAVGWGGCGVYYNGIARWSFEKPAFQTGRPLSFQEVLNL